MLCGAFCKWKNRCMSQKNHFKNSLYRAFSAAILMSWSFISVYFLYGVMNKTILMQPTYFLLTFLSIHGIYGIFNAQFLKPFLFLTFINSDIRNFKNWYFFVNPVFFYHAVYISAIVLFFMNTDLKSFFNDRENFMKFFAVMLSYPAQLFIFKSFEHYFRKTNQLLNYKIC